MRTTLDIDDAVLLAAKEIARATDRTMGEVISQLAKKGLGAGAGYPAKSKVGFPTFAVPLDAEPLTSSAVKTLIADEGLSS